MSKVSKVTIAFGFVLFLASASFAQELRVRGAGYEKGRLEAYQDLKNGLYIIKGWGLPTPNIYPWPLPGEIYKSILKEKYQITIQAVGGCVVDDDTEDYVAGYNAISVAAIETKWGKGILRTVRQQANVEYENKYGERQRDCDKQVNEARKSLRQWSQIDAACFPPNKSLDASRGSVSRMKLY